MHAAEAVDVTEDPFLLDSDGLRALASDAVVRRGLAYFAENRVVELSWDARRLRAMVAGSRADLPYHLEIALGGDGELEVYCDCPFDREAACKHAVAALAAYGARQSLRDDEVTGAVDEAVAERVHRGRTQVVVEHVAGRPDFGTWTARSLAPSGASLRPYRVLIRSATERMNTCTCPDFAVNLLGTCKHIEAVLHRLRKQKGKRARTTRAPAGPPVPVVYLSWDASRGPQLRLRRSHMVDTPLADALDRHFDASGALRGALPDAFFRMEGDLRELGGVHIGDDAASHAQRLVEERAREARAARIREEVLGSQGRLPGVRARLYPYQVEGVAFLASKGRALLADDMGLGKTLQAIAAARFLMAREGVTRVLIVCPASLKHQWAREIERFTDLEAQVVQGGSSPRRAQYRQRAPFTIVNYELVLRDREAIAQDLAPDLIVLDEAQRIRNWRTRTATAVKALPSRYAFVLTGTPLENRLEDLYSLMQVVDPRVLGPLWQFLVHYHVTDARGSVLGYRNLSELRLRLASVMLRRDKRLVRDQLPDRIEQRLDVELTAKQRALHDASMNGVAALAQIRSWRPLTPAEEKQLLSHLQRARMACNAAGLVDETSQGSPKLEELGRLLDELCKEGGQKAVVFSQWERMTRMAEEVATGLGLGCVRLHGGVPTASRGALIDRFHEDPDCQVFLSTDAGATGLNLQCATVLINLEYPFNPAVLAQRVGRVHRLGQREAVQVVYLMALDSYEQRVAALLSAKRELFVNAVEPEAEEDVVGLSPRLLDLALEAAGEEAAGDHAPRGEAAEGPRAASAMGPVPNATDAVPGDAPGDAPDATTAAGPDAIPGPLAPEREEASADERFAAALAAVQRVLGEHLERVLATPRGLVCLTRGASDDLMEEAEAQAADPMVAVVDARAWAALARVGAPAVEGARETWSRAAAPGSGATSAEAPLAAMARRHLDAAEALVGTRPRDALEQMASAMFAALAQRAGLSEVPDRGNVVVWLYTDLVPRGLATPEMTHAVLRAHGLASSPDVPLALAAEVLGDAHRLVATATA